MTDLMTLWSLFKDSTTLQAVLGALIGFLVMQVFQQRRTTMPNLPMDERLMPGFGGGLSTAAVPGDLPFGPGSKLQKQKTGRQPSDTESERKLLEMLDDEESEEGADEDHATGQAAKSKREKPSQAQKKQKQKAQLAANAKEASPNELRHRRGRRQVADESVDRDVDEEDEDDDDESAEDREAAGEVDEKESEDEEADRGMVPYSNDTYSEAEMLQRATAFCDMMSRRRSCRHFSEQPVDPKLVELLISAAGSAPSGAHTEPWTYVCVTNELMKRRIREIVEEEEEINYARRMGPAWKADVARMRTDWEKPYLTEAPVIVVLMRQVHGWRRGQDEKRQHYYSEISVSISAGLFLAAVQNVGLCTLSSTPMNAGPALRRLLDRPPNEKVHLLLPLGYAAHNAQVPNLKRKPLDKIMVSM